MDINSYYKQIIKELEASARDASKSAEQAKIAAQTRLEEAQMSSSRSPEEDKEHSCDKECKYTKLRNKFSPELLSKLMEYNLDPNSFSPMQAIKKLLTLGMPMEHVLLDLERNGTDIEGVKNMLAKHGLSGHLNAAIANGIANRSTSSAVAFAQGIIEKNKPQERVLTQNA